jgi:hypothetical protein
MVGEVERMGYSLLRGLDRLGFVHQTKEGETFAVRFDTVRVYGNAWAAFHVDAEKLYHFSVADLSKPDVVRQLQSVIKRPVRAFDDKGLAYVVTLQERPRVRLPERVELDLSARPAGELLVPIGLGRCASTGSACGEAAPIWIELAKLKHMMIAGTSDSGKSTWIHSAIAALATGATPAQVRIALIDPKRSEFAVWDGLPHLWGEVAHTTDQAADLVMGLAREVDKRGDTFRRVGSVCKDIAAYNKLAGVDARLPYIVCIVDECLDLVGESKALDEALRTLATRGRSAGVFLWMATQHGAAMSGMPRVVNVNLGTRLVFRVTDGNAAQAAGCPGAQNIPSGLRGRMLAKLDDAPCEVQAFYLSDDELELIAGELGAGQAQPAKPLASEDELALLAWAAKSNGGYLSVADIQARMSPGQKAARRLAEKLEADGLLEKDAGAGNRRKVTDKAKEMM